MSEVTGPDLRQLVREVLREFVSPPAGSVRTGAAPPAPGPQGSAANPQRSAANRQGSAANPQGSATNSQRAVPARQRREVGPETGRSRPAAGPSPSPPRAGPGPAPAEAGEAVRLRTDADLDEFVRRLLHLYENPKTRADLRAGKLRFRLAGASVESGPAPRRRIEKGAVTERQVADAARAGVALVLARRAVLTPLGRDRARALGVTIERES